MSTALAVAVTTFGVAVPATAATVSAAPAINPSTHAVAPAVSQPVALAPASAPAGSLHAVDLATHVPTLALFRPVYARVSSRFGMRFHPILKRYRLHAGIDYSARCGRRVYAAASGRVFIARRAGGYGKMVAIDHRGPLSTRYAHLSRISVRYGQYVRRGQYIGRVGATGLATGCHLHFETRRYGKAVNPLRYFR